MIATLRLIRMRKKGPGLWLRIPCHVIEVPRIAFDLDSIADLQWLVPQRTLTRSTEVLRELGVAARLGS